MSEMWLKRRLFFLFFYLNSLNTVESLKESVTLFFFLLSLKREFERNCFFVFCFFLFFLSFFHSLKREFERKWFSLSFSCCLLKRERERESLKESGFLFLFFAVFWRESLKEGVFVFLFLSSVLSRLERVSLFLCLLLSDDGDGVGYAPLLQLHFDCWRQKTQEKLNSRNCS